MTNIHGVHPRNMPPEATKKHGKAINYAGLAAIPVIATAGYLTHRHFSRNAGKQIAEAAGRAADKLAVKDGKVVLKPVSEREAWERTYKPENYPENMAPLMESHLDLLNRKAEILERALPFGSYVGPDVSNELHDFITNRGVSVNHAAGSLPGFLHPRLREDIIPVVVTRDASGLSLNHIGKAPVSESAADVHFLHDKLMANHLSEADIVRKHTPSTKGVQKHRHPGMDRALNDLKDLYANHPLLSLNKQSEYRIMNNPYIVKMANEAVRRNAAGFNQHADDTEHKWEYDTEHSKTLGALGGLALGRMAAGPAHHGGLGVMDVIHHLEEADDAGGGLADAAKRIANASRGAVRTAGSSYRAPVMLGGALAGIGTQMYRDHRSSRAVEEGMLTPTRREYPSYLTGAGWGAGIGAGLGALSTAAEHYSSHAGVAPGFAAKAILGGAAGFGAAGALVQAIRRHDYRNSPYVTNE